MKLMRGEEEAGKLLFYLRGGCGIETPYSGLWS